MLKRRNTLYALCWYSWEHVNTSVIKDVIIRKNLPRNNLNFIKSSFTNVFLSGVTITHVVKNLMESMWAGSSATKLKLTHPREPQVYDQATWKKL
jgi:hypothetical protein